MASFKNFEEVILLNLAYRSNVSKISNWQNKNYNHMESQNIVHVFATWKVKEGHVDTVLNLLRTIQKESIKEKGNLFYTIQQSNSDANTLILFEGYKNDAAIEEHRNTAYFQELLLGKIVPLLANREIVLTTPIE